MKNDDDPSTRSMADTDIRADDGGGCDNMKTVPDDEGTEDNTTQ